MLKMTPAFIFISFLSPISMLLFLDSWFELSVSTKNLIQKKKE